MSHANVWQIMLGVFSTAFVLFIASTQAAEQCLPGQFHKKTSSPATQEYAECKAWSADTCCTANFTRELNRTRVRDLYGFHWGHCKNISKECEKFLLEEECFYQCEPRLFGWHVGNASLQGVPICANYCDSWYEACKDDQTCVEDWLADFEYTNSTYKCPKNAQCRTFKQIYGNGENLCNKMWGKTFVYTDPTCPCSRMDGPIPSDVHKNSTCSGSSSTRIFSTPSAGSPTTVFPTRSSSSPTRIFSTPTVSSPTTVFSTRSGSSPTRVFSTCYATIVVSVVLVFVDVLNRVL